MRYWKAIIRWSCSVLAVLLFAVAYYLRQTHLATDASIAAIQESLRWIQIANNITILAACLLFIPYLWRFIEYLKEEYKKENAAHK